eukprot:1184740-Prorocentrum_minimum.AAC.2
MSRAVKCSVSSRLRTKQATTEHSKNRTDHSKNRTEHSQSRPEQSGMFDEGVLKAARISVVSIGRAIGCPTSDAFHPKQLSRFSQRV